MCDDTYIPWLAALNIKEAFGAFVVVVEFLLVIRVKKSLFCLVFSSTSYTIFSIHVLAVGNTPYVKWHTSQTEPP